MSFFMREPSSPEIILNESARFFMNELSPERSTAPRASSHVAEAISSVYRAWFRGLCTAQERDSALDLFWTRLGTITAESGELLSQRLVMKAMVGE